MHVEIKQDSGNGLGVTARGSGPKVSKSEVRVKGSPGSRVGSAGLLT